MYRTLYETENVTFYYDQAHRELIQKWDGYVPSRVFRFAIDELVKIADQHAIVGIISDTTDMGALSPSDNQYASEVMPFLFMKGIKFMAFLVSEKALGKMALNRFTKANKSEMNIGHFSEEEEAKAWIRNNRF